MQRLTARVTKIVGTPNPKNWSQVYTFFPDDEEKKQKRGSLLAVLTLTTEVDEDEITSVGREILSRLHEEYYGETSLSVFEKITQTLEKIPQEFTTKDGSLEIVAAVLVGPVLYVTASGKGEVWLSRQGHLARILEGEEGKAQNASGYVEEDDLIVLGTASFFEVCPVGVLKAAIETGDTIESLNTLVHSQETASQVAVLVGKVEAEAVVEAEPVVVSEVPEKKPDPLIRKIWGKIPRFSLGAIYVRRPEMGKRRRVTFFLVALILIALLASSVVLGARKREQDEKEKKYLQTYEETLKMLEEGQALSTLNPARSREILLASQSKISEMETLKIETSKTSELKDKLVKALAGVIKEYKLTDVPVFADLTLMASDGRGDRMALFGQSLIILDKTKNRVLGLDMERKSPEILAGGGTLSETKLVSIDDGFGYILEKDGVAKIDVGNKKTVKAVIKNTGEWGQIAAMGIFGGSIYLLDTGKNEIWRYGASVEGFGVGQSWFVKGTTPGLSGVVSMAVDGAIWGLTQDGKILKFIQGSPTAFGVSGLATGFSSPSVIYTNDETTDLYILDNGNGRVVVFKKSGEYEAEYLWEGIKEATDMVVQEAGKKIFLLSGSRIYEIELR